jgi:hypothetical protein
MMFTIHFPDAGIREMFRRKIGDKEGVSVRAFVVSVDDEKKLVTFTLSPTVAGVR